MLIIKLHEQKPLIKKEKKTQPHQLSNKITRTNGNKQNPNQKYTCHFLNHQQALSSGKSK